LEWEAGQREAAIGSILIAYKMNEQAFWETKNIDGVQFQGISTSNKKRAVLIGTALVLLTVVILFLIWKKKFKKRF
jgi:hypothetical protein